LSDTPIAMLIVVRQADMRVVHPRQDNSRVCARCAQPVAIYPSGQLVLVAHPETEIVCNRCYRPGDVDVAYLAPGARAEARESVPKEAMRAGKCTGASTGSPEDQ
jgi:hypothetical protein